ncbi:hypothetical protein LTR09_010236 [Extremus antarcticus]|uniref:non-specific serine/threonine protein kinase n=1 Tax=Extremus antarcticus TaxID=702011 RepID=A0AAJ0D7V5_9PEZI|nr:hypothetical protein LTR09_010236 [Extremus antarcticus]
MPRQVYGKKTRAVHDPHAIFGSPQRSSPTNVDHIPTIDVADKLGKLKLDEKAVNKDGEVRRRVLSDKSANAVVLPLESLGKETKGRQRAGRKIVVEDDADDEEGGYGVEKPDDGNEEMQTAIGQPEESGKEGVLTQEDRSNDTDDVPLFVEDHGYDTVEEDAETAVDNDDHEDGPAAIRTAAPVSEKDELATLSITILPPTPPPLDSYSEHCAALLSHSHHPLIDFTEWSTQLQSHFALTKIAEASFGEVYRLSLLEQLPGFSSTDESVFKVIALRPPGPTIPLDKRKQAAAKKKLDAMSAPEDVANEVRLLQRMSTIPGYTNFRDVRIVQGRPPPLFAQAFKAWNAEQKARKKDLSHFPDPGKKASYSEDQLWAVIEMQDAGTDLENLVERGGCSSIWSVWDVFWQVVLSLAKGEEGAEFEHRDLHLGNICVRQTTTTGISEKDIDPKRKLNFTGLETTVIDYTISRARMQDNSVAYQDLARDSALFEGDSTEEYQYDIYRYMRGAVLADDPYASPPFTSLATTEERSWQQYHPVTNLLWLHFVLYKLLEQVEWPSASKAPPRKRKEEFTRWKRANDLEHVLLRVQELLDPGMVCGKDGIKSAGELVGLALGEGWVDVGDVVGETGTGEEEGEGEGDDETIGAGLAVRLEELALERGEGEDDVGAVVDVEVLHSKPRTRRKR